MASRDDAGAHQRVQSRESPAGRPGWSEKPLPPSLLPLSPRTSKNKLSFTFKCSKINKLQACLVEKAFLFQTAPGQILKGRSSPPPRMAARPLDRAAPGCHPACFSTLQEPGTTFAGEKHTQSKRQREKLMVEQPCPSQEGWDRTSCKHPRQSSAR